MECSDLVENLADLQRRNQRMKSDLETKNANLASRIDKA